MIQQPIRFFDLFKMQQWCPWKYGIVSNLATGKRKKRKIPISKKKLMNPNPRVGEVGIKFYDSAHFWDYDDAVDFCRNYPTRRKYVTKRKVIKPLLLADGSPQVGFCLPQKPCGIVVLDIDDCFLDDGTAEPSVTKFIERISSYAELSPSGSGYRAFILGSVPFTKTVIKHPDGFKIEVFAANSWATYTGNQISKLDLITEECDVLNELIALFNASAAVQKTKTDKNKQLKAVVKRASTNAISALPTLLDEDMQLLNEIQNSKQGQKFVDLWSNDRRLRESEYNLPSRFHAIRSLVRILAFWSRKNQPQMLRIMQNSPVVATSISRWRHPRELEKLITKQCRLTRYVRPLKKPLVQHVINIMSRHGAMSTNEVWERVRQTHSKSAVADAIDLMQENQIIRKTVSAKRGRPTVRYEIIPLGEF